MPKVTIKHGGGYDPRLPRVNDPTLEQPVAPEPAPQREDPKPTASEQLGIPVRGFAADGRKLSPVRPEGADMHDARTRRREFVRDMLRRYPNKRTSGADSVIEHVRKAFGIGISPEAVEQIREEAAVAAKILGTAVPSTIEQIEREIAAATPTGEVNAADLEAAVQLVLGAVPGLQTFTISVDENGEASVDYQVRKVVVTTTGGSLKVRR